MKKVTLMSGYFYNFLLTKKGFFLEETGGELESFGTFTLYRLLVSSNASWPLFEKWLSSMGKFYVRELKDQPKFRDILNFSTIKEEKDAEKERYEVISTFNESMTSAFLLGRGCFYWSLARIIWISFIATFIRNFFFPLFYIALLLSAPQNKLLLWIGRLFTAWELFILMRRQWRATRGNKGGVPKPVAGNSILRRAYITPLQYKSAGYSI